jgi:membrane associated rhomboid family serine protease
VFNYGIILSIKLLEDSEGSVHNKKQDWKIILLGLVLIAALGWLSWSIISFFIESLIKADAKISAAVIGGMFTILAGLGVVLITQHQTKKELLKKPIERKK